MVMAYKPWYVYFFSNGVQKCICFEDDEQQARFFASQVNGRLMHGHIFEDQEKNSRKPYALPQKR